MTKKLLAVLMLCSGTLQAQNQSLVGTWQVNFQAGMRIEDGVATPIMGTGTLTVEAAGDSLIGMLAPTPAPDMPSRPPMRLAARASAGEATFLAHSKATINVNGAEHEASVVSTWVLRAKGDGLEGTVARQIDSPDAGPQEPRPVTGTRKKG